MNVTRDVMLDLLPVYLSGEASADTRVLVEAFLKEDPELAKKLRNEWLERTTAAAPSDLPPELELRALSRTKRLIAWERWLMGFAIFFTAIGFSLRIEAAGWQVTRLGLALQDHPVELAVCLGLAGAFWTGHLVLRHRLRASSF